jgi:hypothetical protein
VPFFAKLFMSQKKEALFLSARLLFFIHLSAADDGRTQKD